MRILREYLGGQHELNLGTREGWEEFWRGVVQDFDAAVEYVTDLRAASDGEKLLNEDEPEFIERWTLLEDAPTWHELNPEDEDDD